MSSRGGSPTLESVALVLFVFLAQTVAATAGFGVETFALSAPLDERAWTLVTSVYAHGSLAHAATNVVALVIFGTLLERATTRVRFHAFVVLTGAVAGVAEVFVSLATGTPTLVLGISGSVFAIMGYLLASNPVTEAVSGWLALDRRSQFLMMVFAAAALTYVTGGENAALVAHFTGFVLGLVAGRARVLHVVRLDRQRGFASACENTRYK